jgi:hypothetical protein
VGAEVHRAITLAAEGSEEAAAAATSAISASGKATAGFAQALGASAAEGAGILALFEAAAAIASFASGNVPAGIAHSLASAKFTAVAAMGGGGATPSTSGGGGGGGAMAGGAAVTSSGGGAGGEAQAMRGAEILADALADKLGGGGQTIIIDQRNSIIADDLALYQRTANGARQAGVNLNDLQRMGRR